MTLPPSLSLFWTFPPGVMLFFFWLISASFFFGLLLLLFLVEFGRVGVSLIKFCRGCTCMLSSTYMICWRYCTLHTPPFCIGGQPSFSLSLEGKRNKRRAVKNQHTPRFQSLFYAYSNCQLRPVFLFLSLFSSLRGLVLPLLQLLFTSLPPPFP